MQLINLFLKRHVLVKSSAGVVEGILIHVEVGEHEGIGNLFVETHDSTCIVRGNQILAIATRR